MQHSLLDLVCDRGYRLLDLDLVRAACVVVIAFLYTTIEVRTPDMQAL